MNLSNKIEEVATRIKNDVELSRDYREDPVYTIQSLVGEDVKKGDFSTFVEEVNDRIDDDDTVIPAVGLGYGVFNGTPFF